VLHHSVLHVDHLFSVAREGGGKLVEDASFNAALQLRSVEEVLALVPTSEEEPPIALVLALGLGLRQQQLPVRTRSGIISKDSLAEQVTMR
jgi:hypothetical protein